MSSGELTAHERALWVALESARGADSLLSFIPEAAKARGEDFMRPDHLEPLADAFSRALTSRVRVLFSVPPRFGKTEMLLHGIAWWLWLRPEDPLAYLSYSGTFAKGKSRRARDFAKAIGIPLRNDANSAEEWLTTAGGGLRARGRGGAITGHGARVLIVDDPFANREEAESPTIRQNVMDWYTSTATTRVQKGGSVIVVHTRWHDDDLIGRLAEQDGWEYINLPAVDDSRGGDGSLWPALWPRSELDLKRREVGEYDWSSMFQGEPRPRGAEVFRGDTRYQFPLVADATRKWRIVIGADPAATEKTTSDYSVAVVLAVSGQPGTVDFQADVLEVYRQQVEIPKFVQVLKMLADKWQAPLAVESVGGFKAVPQMLRMLDKSLRIYEVHPLGDKFTRALPVAAAWNDGRVRVPAQAPWLKDFLKEVTKFTGVKDKHDDQVDALAHAYNSIVTTKPATGHGVHQAPKEFR